MKSGRAIFCLVYAPTAATHKPSLQRALAFLGWDPGQQMLDFDVFIQLRPMDTFAVAYQAPIPPFHRCPMYQPWEPGQGYADSSPIVQFHNQLLIGHLYRLRAGLMLNY